MLDKLLLLALLTLVSIGCGDDEAIEPEVGNDCRGEVSIAVDGASEAFDSPLSATLVELNFESGTELLIAWVKNGKSINLQVVIDDLDLACFPTGRIELTSLPSNISIFSFQYIDIDGPISSVSNIFIEDGGDGWIDVKSCDGENDIISVDFGFNAISQTGDLIAVTGGSAKDVCFVRTK